MFEKKIKKIFHNISKNQGTSQKNKKEEKEDVKQTFRSHNIKKLKAIFKKAERKKVFQFSDENKKISCNKIFALEFK